MSNKNLAGINISSCTRVKETTVEESNNGNNGFGAPWRLVDNKPWGS